MLYCIHETALHLVEDDYTKQQQDTHEDKTIPQSPPGEIALAEGGILEGFDDGGHGVEHDKGAQCLIGDHADGVDDRGGVHPQ